MKPRCRRCKRWESRCQCPKPKRPRKAPPYEYKRAFRRPSLATWECCEPFCELPLIGIEEVASLLSITVDTARALTEQRFLPSVQGPDGKPEYPRDLISHLYPRGHEDLRICKCHRVPISHCGLLPSQKTRRQVSHGVASQPVDAGPWKICWICCRPFSERGYVGSGSFDRSELCSEQCSVLYEHTAKVSVPALDPCNYLKIDAEKRRAAAALEETGNTASSVYILASSRLQIWKIGKSDRPLTRLVSIQRSERRILARIEMVGLILCDSSDQALVLEAILHGVFGSRRRYRREWFDLEEDDLALLVGMRTAADAAPLAAKALEVSKPFDALTAPGTPQAAIERNETDSQVDDSLSEDGDLQDPNESPLASPAGFEPALPA